jgi:small neutral amino acid transporter SnatA (MarC family)
MSENSSTVTQSTPTTSQSQVATGPNLSVFIFLSAAALIGSFFLPWINIGGLLTASGYKYSLADDTGMEARMFLAIPLTAAITLLMGCVSQKQLRGAARITGLLPIAALIYVLVRYGKDVTQLLGAGAWISICLGVVLFALGCVKPKS